MKISIQAYKDTFTWETEADGVDLQEAICQIKGLLVAVGFHPKSVDEHFSPDSFEWFPDLDPKIDEDIAYCKPKKPFSKKKKKFDKHHERVY